MIDLHNHILPGLDDGAQTLEESVEMCRVSFHDGIRTIVATPHTLNGVYENDRSTILAKVRELNDTIQTLLSAPKDPVDLKILPGADVHFSAGVLTQLDREKAITIGDGGKFLSLEFPFQGIPYRAEVILFDLVAAGIIPIISHPERNLEIARRPQRYCDMVHMGCLGQLSAMSLTGGFGREVSRTAEKLLKKRLVHFIASDAHSSKRRPPLLSLAVRKAAKIVGEEEAKKMVTEYPQAVLEGRRPNIPEPIEMQ